MKKTKIKAVALLSGGLDSQLAIKLMLEQGIDVTAVYFKNIFGTFKSNENKKSPAEKCASDLGVTFVELDNTKELLAIVKKPKHGHGSRMNPCIDCKIFMLKKVKRYMKDIGAKFIITGEVLGQRPMSQHRPTLQLIEKNGGLKDLIVRPLSGRLMQETIPEKKGWINRNKLLGHSGRSRKVQIELAEKFRIKDYPNAAGGCLLTDPCFSERLKESFDKGEDSIKDMPLLKYGRHFRLYNKYKLIIGRNELENKKIIELANNSDIIIEPIDEIPGPTSLLKTGLKMNLSKLSRDEMKKYLELALKMCAGYCDSSSGVDIVLRVGIKKIKNILWYKQYIIKESIRIIDCNDYCRRV